MGAGFIGLEVAENLLARGLSVTVIDALPQILPNVFDPEMAGFAQRQLKAAGMRVMTSCPLKAITGSGRVEGVETGAGTLPADLVILSIGIRPNTAWLEGSGIALDKGCDGRGRVRCHQPGGRLRRRRLRRGHERHHRPPVLERHGVHAPTSPAAQSPARSRARRPPTPARSAPAWCACCPR